MVSVERMGWKRPFDVDVRRCSLRKVPAVESDLRPESAVKRTYCCFVQEEPPSRRRNKLHQISLAKQRRCS